MYARLYDFFPEIDSTDYTTTINTQRSDSSNHLTTYVYVR